MGILFHIAYAASRISVFLIIAAMWLLQELPFGLFAKIDMIFREYDFVRQ